MEGNSSERVKKQDTDDKIDELREEMRLLRKEATVTLERVRERTQDIDERVRELESDTEYLIAAHQQLEERFGSYLERQKEAKKKRRDQRVEESKSQG